MRRQKSIGRQKSKRKSGKSRKSRKGRKSRKSRKSWKSRKRIVQIEGPKDTVPKKTGPKGGLKSMCQQRPDPTPLDQQWLYVPLGATGLGAIKILITKL